MKNDIIDTNVTLWIKGSEQVARALEALTAELKKRGITSRATVTKLITPALAKHYGVPLNSKGQFVKPAKTASDEERKAWDAARRQVQRTSAKLVDSLLGKEQNEDGPKPKTLTQIDQWVANLTADSTISEDDRWALVKTFAGQLGLELDW